MSVPASQTHTHTTTSSTMSALRFHKSFLILLLARMVTRFGHSIDYIAYSWMVYQLTGSKMLMGSLFAMNFVPGILFSLFAGVLVDRLPKKPLLVMTYAVRFVIVALTAFLFIKGWILPWHLFLFTFLNSTFECFSTPAETSLVPRLLPKRLLLSGNSLITSASRVAELAGLAVTGPLIAWIGLAGAIWGGSGAFLVSALIVLFIRIPSVRKEVGPSLKATEVQPLRFWQQLKQGLQFVRSERILLYTLSTSAVINMGLTPINVMQPVYVQEILQAGPATQSVLGGAMTLGMILSGFGLGIWGPRFRKSTLIVSGCFLLGTGQICLFIPSSTSILPLVIAGCGAFASGLALPLISTTAATYMMEAAPQAMLGRVSSVSSMVGMAFIPLGSVGVGAAGSFVDVEWLFMSAGILVMIPPIFLLTQKKFMKI
ncbi:MFS transporter [Paenibacillus paeoniae]|uniref:MFS transporter n=1 Tax=Paenibacillus paeoniae TaxID=2292705 RepID=A0A371P778_9BACL|nr:MFS transporter [Paenibacillus paeoniae]REK71316.1 MFS transporter [Paenibacillus paeoniae]